MPEPITRIQLELLALGELSFEQEQGLRAHIAGDSDLAQRFARIEREIGAARPLPALPLELLSEAPPPSALPPSSPRWPRWAPLGALAALAAAALVLLWLRPEADPTVAFRGAMDLEVVRIREGAAVRQGERVAARAGDRLQYIVTVPEAGFVSVFDVQDDGAVALWKDAEPVVAGGSVSGAAILDAYPGLERVVFLWAAEPVSRERFEAAVRARLEPLALLEPIPGLEGASQRSILLLEDE